MRKRAAGNMAVCQPWPLTNQTLGGRLPMRLLTNQRRGMSVSEGRHADQLVVGGGASVHSDSDHGSVRHKATTTTTYYFPGLGTYLGMTFVLLTLMSCQPVLGIQADIFPTNEIIEVGTDLNITCTLRNETGLELEMPTSSDIVWYKDKVLISSENYHIVDNMTSSICIVNAYLSDSATYYCGLVQDTDFNEYQSSTVQVGYKPQPASLTCVSYNILDFSCEWDPFETHIENESHTFQYIYKEVWKDCPDLVSPTNCSIGREHHSSSRQELHVISSNDLGDAVQTAFFNPDADTIPLPPSNIVVTSTGSTVLQVSWDIPPYWPFDFLLEYRLQYASQYDPDSWLELPCSSSRICDIRQLDPYTKYTVKVSCYYTSNPRKTWGEWSAPVEGRTDDSAPIGTVQNIQTTDEDGANDYERNVSVSWQPVPEREQRGPILGYEVRVSPHSGCVDQQTLTETLNITEVIIEGLEKFCSYTVGIKAFNSVGFGPVEDVVIEDLTEVSLPPSVVRAEALSHQSVLVSWDKPTPVHGYIDHYTVHWIKARGQDLGKSIDVPATNLTYRVDGLEGYVLYSFKVSVTNRIGVSGWSMEAIATTEEWIPEAAPTNLTVDPIPSDPNSLLVNWIDISEEDAHGEIQGHHIYYCRVAEESLSAPPCSLNAYDCLDKQERQTYAKTTQKPVTLPNLDPYSQYLISVSAFTNVGVGPNSSCPLSERTSEGTPSKPLNVRVTESSATSIGLTWSPPLVKNGIIRNYTILVKSNSSTDQQEFYAGGVQSYLVKGLYGYVHYTLQVRACTIMCGAASDEVYQKTSIGVPEQPENLEVQPLPYNLVKASWNPPVHPNGPIDHYLVSYRHQEPSTPSPPIIHVRSASLTSTLANRIDDWHQTTELTMSFEVDCSQAPFLFQVVAVNVIEGSLSGGEAAEFVLSECMEPASTYSPLIWLILPGGAILLFTLLISLHYVQSKLGKSWPDPVYTDMVKNRKDGSPIPRPKKVEKEEFDTLQIVCPPDLEEVIVAEEYPSQPYQCPMQTSMTDVLTDSLDIKTSIGGKEAYLRTVSIDSGVPPSPQDHLDFSSTEDVFHAEDYDKSEWMHDTYSFGNPKVIVSHASLGIKGGHFPKRSLSLSSSDGYGLPAIEEDKFMDPIMEKVPRDKGTITAIASSSNQPLWLDDDDEEDDVDEVAYSRISKLSSPRKHQPGKGQCAPINQNKLDGPVEGHMVIRTEQASTSSDSGNHSMASNSGYIRNDIAYMKFGINEVTQETSFKSKPDDDYVPGPLTYSVLALPQVGQQPARPSEKSITSSCVSEESLAYTKLGMASDATGNEDIKSSPSPVALVGQPSSQPGVQMKGIGYVKLGELSGDKKQEDVGTEEQESSSWNDMPLPSPSPRLSDYVRGVDLHKMLELESELSESAGSPASSVCTKLELGTEKGEVQNLPEVTLHDTKVKQLRGNVVRSRTDSTSSSSGYGSDNRGQVSGYVVVSNQQNEKSDNYANLAFTSSESETDSDVDVKSEKSVYLQNEKKLGKSGNRDHDTSFVEYISNDSFGVGFINDYPSPSEGVGRVGLSDSVTPCLDMKGHRDGPKTLQQGCKSIPGYISHSAVPGAETMSSRRPDIYQVPSKDCRKLGDGTRQELAEGDDGYVPCGEDSGYVLRVLDGSQPKDEYMPMSPIRKTRIAEDCL